MQICAFLLYYLVKEKDSNNFIVYTHLNICFDSTSLLRFALVIHSGSASLLGPVSDGDDTRVEPN